MRTIFTLISITAFALALSAVTRSGDLTRNDASFLSSGETLAHAAGPDMAEAVFVVHCYDVGYEALKGMKGVMKVERGFQNFREINRVHYDPNIVSIRNLEEALKKAGTYVRTLSTD